MRMIFEQDIEGSDFLEFILTPPQIEGLVHKGLVKDFPNGLYNKRNLNVFIRVDETQGEENAIRFLGEGSEAVRKAIEMLRGDFETLSNINPALGAYFGASLQKQIKKLSNLWR